MGGWDTYTDSKTKNHVQLKVLSVTSTWVYTELNGFLLALLSDERLVNVWNDTTTSDGRFDKRVQLLVSPNGELQVAGSDTLHFQIFGCVSCQLKHLSG